MSKRKKITKVKMLDELIAETVAGLKYISETDAEIIPFSHSRADSVNVETLLQQIGKTDVKIEERSFDDFFAPLIKIQKWFSEDERKQTEKFVRLKELLQENLIEKKVFRVGKIEIDIYVVGLDKENILRGIQTKAVET
jgi:Nuclease A inhibitor-like protein